MLVVENSDWVTCYVNGHVAAGDVEGADAHHFVCPALNDSLGRARLGQPSLTGLPSGSHDLDVTSRG